MTELGTPTGRPSQAAHGLLAALVGLALLLAGILVGAVPAAAGNRVGASTPVMINTVGAATDISPGQRLGKTVPQPSFVVATGVAAESESGLVNLASEARTSHILDGEVRPNGSFGGGHRAGTGFPKKSEFPASWSDDQIMHNISDVATDPASVFRPGRGGDVFGTGTRGGIDIEVLLRNDEIWTGYPTNVPRNP